MTGNRVILGTVARLKGSLRMSLKTVLSAAMLLCASTTLIGVDSAAAYPVPKPVPTAWELKCTPGVLRLFADPADGKLYWYMTYQVQNASGRDQIWVPDMTLFSDTGVISKAGVGVPGRVSESIRALQGNPLLETQDEIIGDLRQGAEYARDGLAVWPVQNDRANEVSIFVAGLSGETAREFHPVSGEAVILRKSLHLKFMVDGDLEGRLAMPATLMASEWVIR